MKAAKVMTQIIFAVLVFSALGFAKLRHSAKQCQNYQINFLNNSPSFLSQGDILTIVESEVDSIIGYPINQIPIYKIENKIESITNIENAEVYVSLDNCLHVDIEQKTPIARLKLKNNQEFYIDKKGSIFDLSLNHTERILVASGHISDSVDIHQVFLLTKYIDSNPFWKSQIVQIYFKHNKEIELIPRVGNHTILLGSISDFKEKLEKLKFFYKQGVQQTGWNHYKEINLKYKDQIVCVKK